MKRWLGSMLIVGLCLSCSSSNNPSTDAGAPKEAGAPQEAGRPRDGSSTEIGIVKTAAGEPLGDPIKATIGPSGGTLETTDGRLVVTFPEGAVASDTEVSLTLTSNTFPTGVGVAYKLEPSSVTFAKPVSLTVHADESDLTHSSIGGLDIAWQDSDGYWEPVEELTRDASAKTVTAKVTHFCTFSLLFGYILSPKLTEVSNGRPVKLQIVRCAAEKALTSSTMIYSCDSIQKEIDAGKIVISKWAVNSKPGGSQEVGLLTGDTQSEHTYTAPPKTPKPPTVAVSADVTDIAWTVTVISNITILEENNLTGTFNMAYKPGLMSPLTAAVTNQPFSVRGYNLTIARIDDGAMETNYEMTGKVGIAPSAFSLGSDVVCKINQREKDISPTNMKVIKGKDPKSLKGNLRWTLATGWTYTCYFPLGFTSEITASIMFGTGTGMGCLTPNDLALDNYLQPSGKATSNCMGDGETAMTFDFYAPSH